MKYGSIFNVFYAEKPMFGRSVFFSLVLLISIVGTSAPQPFLQLVLHIIGIKLNQV